MMRFKVELRGSSAIGAPEEPVYRVLELLPTHTLHHLHALIQRAFGWDDDHLYAFFMDRKGWRSRRPYWSPYCGDTPSATDAVLEELGLRLRRKFQYLFDFGDEWWHDVEFLGYAARQPGMKYPRIAGGGGRAPAPVSVGG